MAGAPWLVRSTVLRRWTSTGYDATKAKDADAVVTVLTPEPTVRVLAAGYVPVLHPTA